MCFLAFALMLPIGDVKSEIKDDEVVVFYPTCGYQVDDGRAWKLSIHGSIFEPEGNSLKRAAALGLLRRLLRLSSKQAEAEIFKQRARSFLVDNEGGKTIHVRLGDQMYPAGTSDSNGHFTSTLQLASAEVERLRRDASPQSDRLTFRAVTRDDDPRTFAGRVQLIGREGLSVISDVDDTIKISMVTSRRALMANTFLRPFEPVEGMPKLYREWADAGAVFHYLSASPWQLYGPLGEFRRSEGFPAGSFHLKLFRLKDSTALDMFGSQERYKSGVIERILADFPDRRFILVGDSGEQDPEIYAAAARKHPDQILRILIRNVGEDGGDAGRFRAAFDGIPEDRWRVFRKPEELKGALPTDSPSE